MDAPFEQLCSLLQTKRVVVLTGAGCSTESGIPDYRGQGRPERPRAPIQHDAFVRSAEARQRYWARATVGWARFSTFGPNAAHRALAALEDRGHIVGVITQNVDRLHHEAGSRRVVELHGALADVVCLGCGRITPRTDAHARLVQANPDWLALASAYAPDGDAEIAVERVREFRVVDCVTCGGPLKPHVVFFGGSVAPATLSAAWGLLDEAEALLVLGSSLAVYSGFRFARRAASEGKPIAIVNQGPTRADALELHVRLDARLGELLPRLAAQLASTASGGEPGP
ncbi:MAG TPA: NAD-dependent protein deacetylase [Polyangiaceae bacterium]|nr:NAD-dependent protein deacetylase [Polyangiaceae bacterium]